MIFYYLEAKTMISKSFAILASVMLTVVGFAVVNIADESNATGSESTGAFNIYVYSENTWSFDANVPGYNAYEALKGSDYSEQLVADDNYIVTDAYGTSNINSNYGAVASVCGVTSGVWTAFVYISPEDNGTFQWVSADAALGFYKPYSDWLSNYRTANIALYHSDDALTAETTNAAISAINNYIVSGTSVPEEKAITSITNTSSYAVTFSLRVSEDYIQDCQIHSDAVTEDDLREGIQITGYGSDCYLALVDALTQSDVVGWNSDTVPDYLPAYQGYSWIDTIFDLGTIQTAGADTPNDWTDDVYVYWNIFTSIPSSGSTYAAYNIGAYSPVVGAPLAANQVSLIYR